MDTIVDRYEAGGAGPKYRAVADAIRGAVGEGALKPGDKLAPVRDLAWRLGITPGTVARAYTILTDEGLLDAQVGRGTFVAGRTRVPPPLLPPEVDAVVHGTEGAGQAVNMISPHLPNVGQTQLIRSLLAQIAQDPPSGLMHYPTHAGCVRARAAVARYLGDVMLGRVGAEDVVLAHGAQNAVMLVMQAVLHGRRPVVLVEALAYPGYRRAAELLRADVVPVAMDEHGLVPEALEEAAVRHGAQLVCLSAEVQNPMLIHMPDARREAIAAVARRCDLQILEDDCYRLGPASALSFRALAPERGWYVTSLSKALTPALRLGFAVAPEGRVADARRAAEYGFFGLATPMTDLCAALLDHPDRPAIQEALRGRVADYVRAMVNILGGHRMRWREDALFVWVDLPAGWRASNFARAAEAQGVQVRTAEDYAARDAAAPHAIRLSVNAGVPWERYEAALHRLRALLDNPPERIAV